MENADKPKLEAGTSFILIGASLNFHYINQICGELYIQQKDRSVVGSILRVVSNDSQPLSHNNEFRLTGNEPTPEQWIVY